MPERNSMSALELMVFFGGTEYIRIAVVSIIL